MLGGRVVLCIAFKKSYSLRNRMLKTKNTQEKHLIPYHGGKALKATYQKHLHLFDH